MAKLTLQNLGTFVRERRGSQGLRAAAAEIGISAPTLSRIESGKLPDLNTFGLLCRWLRLDPAEVLEVVPRPENETTTDVVAAHLKASREIDPETAAALANAIVLTQQILHDAPGSVGRADGERV